MRSVGALQESSDDLLDSLHRLAAQAITAGPVRRPRRALRRAVDGLPAPTGVALAEREDELSDWMADHEIDRDWVIAPALAGAGVDLAWCERAAAALGGARPPGRAGVGGQRR